MAGQVVDLVTRAAGSESPYRAFAQLSSTSPRNAFLVACMQHFGRVQRTLHTYVRKVLIVLYFAVRPGARTLE